MAAVANDLLAAADALGVSPEVRDKAYAQQRALGLSPDDPMGVMIIVAAHLESVAGGLLARIDAAPQIMTDAARKAVQPVADAAAKRANANLIEMQTKAANRAAEAITVAANTTFGSLRTGMWATVGAVWLSTLAIIAAVALAIGIWGGGALRASADSEWTAFAQRADAGEWAALIRANTDLNATLDSYCAAGKNTQGVQSGRLWCAVPLWRDGAPSPGGSAAIATVWSVSLGWLDRWSPLTLLAAGLIGGLLLRRFAKMATWPAPIRWLLDL